MNTITENETYKLIHGKLLRFESAKNIQEKQTLRDEIHELLNNSTGVEKHVSQLKINIDNDLESFKHNPVYDINVNDGAGYFIQDLTKAFPNVKE